MLYIIFDSYQFTNMEKRLDTEIYFGNMNEAEMKKWNEKFASKETTDKDIRELQSKVEDDEDILGKQYNDLGAESGELGNRISRRLDLNDEPTNFVLTGFGQTGSKLSRHLVDLENDLRTYWGVLVVIYLIIYYSGCYSGWDRIRIHTLLIIIY